MENNVLDNFEEKKQPIFANKSMKQLILGILFYGLILFFNVNFSQEFESRKLPALIVLILGITAFVLTIIGLINGIKSIKRKEDSFLKKYGVTTGNLLLVFIMGLILFANFIDFYEFFN